jgi:diacylglycerol kinase (ATP)
MKARVGILCNSDSGRVRSRMPEVRALCRRIAGANYAEVDGATLDGPLVAELLSQQPELLVVVGGDGTLHAVLGRLLAPGRTGPMPAVLAVPAGTTNMSALDLGVRGRPLAVLEQLRARLEQQAATLLPGRPRQILQVTRPGSAPLCGMFFGAGIIARGVEYFSSYVRTSGVTGELASGLVMARFLGALLGADRGGLTAPVYAEIHGMEGVVGRQAYLAILASVADRLLLGTQPYWGSGPGPIHATTVRAKPARLLSSVLPVLRGRGASLRAEDGYASANVHSLTLSLEGPFVIDGQCYDACGAKLSLGTAGPVHFVCA